MMPKGCACGTTTMERAALNQSYEALMSLPDAGTHE
jgi:hypothetical protein